MPSPKLSPEDRDQRAQLVQSVCESVFGESIDGYSDVQLALAAAVADAWQMSPKLGRDLESALIDYVSGNSKITRPQE